MINCNVYNGFIFSPSLAIGAGRGIFRCFCWCYTQLIVRCHIGNDVLHMTVHRYKYMHAHESLACVNVFVNKE